MEIIILDLEWNAAYSRKRGGYLNEIIEFGAVKCGEDLREKSTFSCMVRPQVGKHLNNAMLSLTSITEEELKGGLPFMGAVGKFRRWAGENSIIVTWGPSDVLALIENCKYFSGDEHVSFLKRFCDLQRYAQARMGWGTKEQVGLEHAAELLGLDVSGMEHHRALDDSRMTLEILKRVYEPGSLEEYTDVCDDEFYKRVTFKTTYIRDLNDPLVQPEHLQFDCPTCGETCAANTRWSPKNKGFWANFICKDCGGKFMGRLILKQKYEGLQVNKKTFPVLEIEKPRAAEPGAIGNMQLEINNGVGVLRFSDWNLSGVTHAFSTRIGGVSDKEFAAMNLGFNRGDSNENVAENYRLFCAAAGFDPESLVTGSQTHLTNIRRVGAEQKGIGVWREKDMDDIDGLCTDEAGVTLTIYCADCVPLYFVDEKHHAIGLAHAGWRGTAAGMAARMVEKLAEEYGSQPEDLKVAIGPSICKDCFEVDAPVAEVFKALPNAEAFVTDGPGVKFHVDLWECNRQFLLSAGVRAGNITLGGVCTMDESDLIFSHRKTKGRRGSNCAMLALDK